LFNTNTNVNTMNPTKSTTSGAAKRKKKEKEESLKKHFKDISSFFKDQQNETPPGDSGW